MCEVHPGGLPSLVEEKAFSFIILILHSVPLLKHLLKPTPPKGLRGFLHIKVIPTKCRTDNYVHNYRVHIAIC